MDCRLLLMRWNPLRIDYNAHVHTFDSVATMIEPFTAPDLERIAYLQPDVWQDIVPYFRFYLEATFCRPLKIENADRIAAIGSVIMHAETAWLSHIIVAPDMRRQGLGLAMTRALIDEAENNGRNTQLLIATRMGRPLYEHLGFHLSCEYLSYQQHRPGKVEPSLPVRRIKPADIPGIMALDYSASGEDRHKLLSVHAGTGWVCTGTGDIRGFYLPGIGEGLIVAQDVEAGLALMELRLASNDTVAALPSDNHAANRFLHDQGLAPERTLARMVRNGDDLLVPDMVFNRIGGHVG